MTSMRCRYDEHTQMGKMVSCENHGERKFLLKNFEERKGKRTNQTIIHHNAVPLLFIEHHIVCCCCCRRLHDDVFCPTNNRKRNEGRNTEGKHGFIEFVFPLLLTHKKKHLFMRISLLVAISAGWNQMEEFPCAIYRRCDIVGHK